MLLQASGTNTSVVGTEQTLATLSSFLTYVAYIDISNMQTADSVELRVYTKVLSSSTLRCLYYSLFTGVQSANGGLLQVSIPVPSDQVFSFTMKQIAGSARTYDWKVISL